MHLTGKALGTVSALVALAAGVSDAEGSVLLSSWSNLELPNDEPGLLIDLNGDELNDFQIFANGTHLFFEGLSPGASVASQGGVSFLLYNHGDVIDFSAPGLAAVESFNAVNIYGGINYVGVQFSVASETYTGWLKFDLTDAANPLLLMGGWESLPGMNVEAIPEPSSMVFGATGGLILAAAWNRRRKRA